MDIILNYVTRNVIKNNSCNTIQELLIILYYDIYDIIILIPQI